jgi:hypothetical protein
MKPHGLSWKLAILGNHIVADGNSIFKEQASIFHLEYDRVKQTGDRGLRRRPLL